jgi:hypothetical protein
VPNIKVRGSRDLLPSTSSIECETSTHIAKITVDLHFFGSYSQANFKFASDGHGGTIVYDPPVDASGTKYAAVDNGGVSVVNDTSSQLVADTGSAPRLAHMESNLARSSIVARSASPATVRSTQRERARRISFSTRILAKPA